MLTIESALTKYADCIILILESESAIAELGAFAHVDEIAKKILLINDKQFINSDSFIHKGPIKKVNAKSDFGETIYTDFSAITLCSQTIKERLDCIPHQNAKSIKFNNIEDVRRMDKERILLLSDVIHYLAPVTKNEIITYLKSALFDEWFDFLTNDLAILESFKLIKLTEWGGSQYYLGCLDNTMFLQIAYYERLYIRSEVLLLYRKKYPERLALLAEVAQNGK